MKRVKMLVDSRVSFTKGSIVEVDEAEASRLLSLGFAETVKEKKAAPAPVEAPAEEAPEVKKTKKKEAK